MILRRNDLAAALLAVFILLAAAPASASAGSLRLSNEDIDAVLQDGDDGSQPQLPDLPGTQMAPRRWWPLALSAVLPGLGEVTTGHMRGLPMIAIDGAIWYGVYSKQQDGNDKEAEFEAFALEHWSEDEWEIALANGDLEPFFEEFGVGTSKDDVPLYVPREVDEREWFENAGKWDQFAWGWREYWEDGYQPEPGFPEDWFFADNPTMTPLRNEYILMRESSNDDFETRDTLLSAALLLRAFSVLQMIYLEGFVGRRYEAAGEVKLSMSEPTGGWSASSSATGSGMVAWRMSW